MADNIQQSQADEERKTRELTDKVGNMLKDGALMTGTGVKLVWHDPLLFVRLLDRMIEWGRRVLPRELFNVLSRFLAKVGYISLLAAAPVGLVFGITAGIKNERFSLALFGLAFALLMLVVQYAASKLIVAGEELTLSSPTVMESDSFLRCVSLLANAAGLMTMLQSTVIAIQFEDWSRFWTGVGILLLFEALAFIALHTSLTSTSIVERTPGGEVAIGVVSFFVKAFMRLVPVLFGLAAFALLVLLAITTVQQFRDRSDWAEGANLAERLVSTALLPLFAYVFFAIYWQGVEVIRSILCIKGIEKKCGDQSGA
ncbi:MAG: hypothetical protein WCL44_09795 [bacterium]